MADKPSVVVAAGLGPYRNARRVLAGLELPELRGKKVLLKPNAGRFVPSGKGVTTHPQVVAAAADFFLERGAQVFCGDSPILGVKPMSNLEVGGYLRALAGKGVVCLDVDKAKPLDLAVKEGNAIKRLRVCHVWAEMDYVVSIPVMKTHMHTQVSLSLKNMKGLLYRREKVRLHQLPQRGQHEPGVKMLDVAIADLSGVLAPHLALVDGTVGQEGLGPSAGQPKRMGLVLGSIDYLAADATACALMGIDPNEVHHLRLAARRKRRCLDVRGFSVTPSSFMKLRRRFARPPEKLEIKFSNLNLQDCDSCSACLSTIFAFLKRYEKELDYLTGKGPLKLATGKAVKPMGKDAFLVGNCAIRAVGEGFAVKGCPPVASQIMETIRRRVT